MIGMSLTRSLLAIVMTVTALTLTTPGSNDAAVATTPSPRAAQVDARQVVADTPLAFEANRGQVDARARFVADGDGFTLFVTRRGAVFDLEAPVAPVARTAPEARAPRSFRRVAVALDPVGADDAPSVAGRDRGDSTASYFVGADPDGWQRNVPTFGEVRQRGLWQGIDLVFHGTRAGAEYDFVVAPGSDPARIGYRLRGTDGLRLENGDLMAATAVGDFVHRAPVAFQTVAGERRPVAASYRLADGVVGFDLGAYDPSLPLVIDPVTDIHYATYLGGSGHDLAHAIALQDGDLYLTGGTGSTDFPTTTGPYVASGTDVFVARISPDGAGAADLVASAVLGGTGNDFGVSLAVDGDATYVSGIIRAHDFPTTSDFPTTAGAFDESFNGAEDAFVAGFALGSDGTADLTYSTFVGGSGFDDARGIAVDGGDVYIAGSAESADYPTTEGAFDRTVAGPTDAVLTRLSPDGAGADDLVYSTYFGGSAIDYAWALVVDDGDAYVTGSTWDAGNFPTTPGAYDRSLGGEEDAFLTRISPDGAGAADLVYSTYLGGGSWDDANGIAVADGDAYIVGSARSEHFPSTAGAYDRTFNGETDGFVSRISPDGAGKADLRYSTLLGGRKEDWVTSVAVEGGALYLAGGSESRNFPTTAGAVDRTYNGGVDATVLRLVPRSKGTKDLRYATYLGGNSWDTAYQLVLDDGTAYVAGWTSSTDLHTTDGAYDPVGNPDDGFLIGLRIPDGTYRPDGWIRRDGGGFVGDDVYNSTGDGQTRSTVVRPGARRVYWVAAQNDDDVTDRLLVTGPGSDRRWVVRYFRGGTDVTAQVTGRGLRTALLAPGEHEVVKVRIKARNDAPVGSRRSVRVVTTSLGNRSFEDVVRVRIAVNP